ncbi:hypothetical protein LCGC14_1425730, partial [marine sediment metagenome]
SLIYTVYPLDEKDSVSVSGDKILIHLVLLEVLSHNIGTSYYFII